jgi:hypothetical protein
MTPSNLGIVIGPNLLWSPDLTANIQSANVQSWLVEMFIVHAADLFPGWSSFLLYSDYRY